MSTPATIGPCLRHASGAIERLEAGGLPLGINGAPPYQFGSAKLATGYLLVIFTDGLVEAEDDGEREYCEERVLPVVQALQSGTAAEALKRLLSSVDAFVGLTRQHDDIACLVLRMT
jgi:sigma-B regulation protein RsbU (phosphoserine phosphatase)